VANNNRPSTVARNTSVMAGIDKHITGNVTIGGVSYTPATLKQVFSDENTAIAATDALHKELKDQVQANKQTRVNANLVYALLRSYLIGQYGKQANAVLGDFGMTAPKSTGAKTLKSKTAGATKRTATRQVRNTMGSVQKKKVKGVVEVPVKAVTTITPVMPSTNGTGAPAASNGPAQGTTTPATAASTAPVATSPPAKPGS
jgi:hypothetical protein